MAETEQKITAPVEGQQVETPPTQQEQTISMSAYKTLQKQLQRQGDTIKVLEEKSREGESVEQALTRERDRNKELERDLKVLNVKATAPAELHDVIDSFVNKHGFVPDEEDLALLSSKVTKAETQTTEATPSGSSGVRNSPAGKKTQDFTSDEYLQSIQLDQIKG